MLAATNSDDVCKLSLSARCNRPPNRWRTCVWQCRPSAAVATVGVVTRITRAFASSGTRCSSRRATWTSGRAASRMSSSLPTRSPPARSHPCRRSRSLRLALGSPCACARAECALCARAGELAERVLRAHGAHCPGATCRGAHQDGPCNTGRVPFCECAHVRGAHVRRTTWTSTRTIRRTSPRPARSSCHAAPPHLVRCAGGLRRDGVSSFGGSAQGEL